MKIHECTQGEAAWLQMRVGKVTASELGELVGKDFSPRTGEMPHSYLCKKVAEAWRGHPLPGFTSFAMEQGQLLEDEARKWYAFAYSDHKVRNVGFIEHDNGRCGASPDALLGEDGGLELKAPQAHTHVKYLLKGEVPAEYLPQVHMSLFVSGRAWWRFVSYCRGFPALVVHVDRDEAICAKIEAALAKFYDAFDQAMETLKKADQ